MVIERLSLVNFRNYTNLTIDFKPITVFVGHNGIGKSNILEAITVLSYAKSYRLHREYNLIKFEAKYAQITALLHDKKNINFVITNTDKNLTKQVKIDKIDHKISDLVGIFKTVIFSPESLLIITGSPTVRRKFLDICLSQIDRKYLESLLFVKKIIKQKNELLKQIKFRQAKKSELDFWNKRLAEYFKYIIKKRKKFVDFINNNIQQYYENISDKKTDKIQISYKTSFKNIDMVYEQIDSVSDWEIESQRTLLGTHLDDLNILLNGKVAAETGSRGEIRSIIFCLKLLEIEYLEQQSKKQNEILLLLDDIFSELDNIRRDKIISIIKDRQTIITTTDKEFLDKNLKHIELIDLEKYEKNR